jgi:hypothetical protein
LFLIFLSSAATLDFTDSTLAWASSLYITSKYWHIQNTINL